MSWGYWAIKAPTRITMKTFIIAETEVMRSVPTRAKVSIFYCKWYYRGQMEEIYVGIKQKKRLYQPKGKKITSTVAVEDRFFVVIIVDSTSNSLKTLCGGYVQR